jgi:hypothetical protein
LLEKGAGQLVSSVEEARNVLSNWIRQSKTLGHVPFCGDERAMAKYTWHEQARKVADVLNLICEQA